MKRLALLMTGALVVGSLAYAAPRTLSISEMDTVVAGQIAQDEPLIEQSGNIAIGDAAAGEGNTVRTLDQDAGAALATGDGSPVDIDVVATRVDGDAGHGFIALNGCNDTITQESYDLSDWEVGDDGVIAQTATVTDSFNITTTVVTIVADIADSFNVQTNSLEISGQEGVTALVNAASLDEQDINVNSSFITASTNVPTMVSNPPDEAAVFGGATATGTFNQTNINDSLGVLVVNVGADIPLAF